MRSIRLFFPASAIALAMVAFAPVSASAQFGYPGYPPYRYALPESDLRIEVKPKNASVYVDGYFAGTVDEFDGTFQRLHVEPGEHEIVVHLAGHRSLRQRLYLSPNSTRKIVGTLEPLAPGEAQEPEPVPVEPREPPETFEEQLPPRGPAVPRRPPTPRQPNPPPAPPEPAAPSTSRFGVLSIRVQPDNATLVIDGERWTGPSGNDRLIVQVTPGRHTVEAEKDGYVRFVTEIDVERDRTVPVNISMTKER